ncbi:MAG: hypothetical protein HC859_01305 [Bacteroidia bacterium]|nr:hypothetical protein [Bacteroidia bacterium]
MLYTTQTPTRAIALLSVFLIFTLQSVRAQESAGQHMQDINKLEVALQEKYMTYMSTVAHSSSARKVEKRREELIKSIQETIREAARLRPYKGDASLRTTYLEYLKILQTVFKEDYHKIVDMEEIAEQSYDNMEAYLMAQEQAGDKLEAAALKLEPAYGTYAATHSVRLTEPEKESKLSRKLRLTGEVNHYSHIIYLIFFKSHHQEGYLIKAMDTGDLNAVEQSRNTLRRYAEEGLAKLDTMKPFKGDGSLLNACRRVLEFHRAEAGEKTAVAVDFLIKKDEFEKVRKVYEAKNSHTNADMDEYNLRVNELNAAVQEYNKNNQSMNQERSKAFDHWVNTKKRFMDSHVPR